MRVWFFLYLLVAFAFAGRASILHGEEADPDSPENSSWFGPLWHELERWDQFLGTDLPVTLAKYDLTFEYRPKFSDLVNREFLRFPFLLRYGLSEKIELDGLWTPFVPNPFRSGRYSRWGPGESGVAIRYNSGAWKPLFDRSTLTGSVRWPWGKPPPDFNDGYTHLVGVFSFSRDLSSVPDAMVYCQVSYDRAVNTPWKDFFPENDRVRQHIAEVTPGWLQKKGDWGYYFQTTLRHIEEPDQTRLAQAFRPGIFFEIPEKWIQRWHLPGSWHADAAYEITLEERKDLRHSVYLKLRVRANLKEWRESSRAGREVTPVNE